MGVMGIDLAMEPFQRIIQAVKIENKTFLFLK